MSYFSFRRGPVGLGVGVANLAFVPNKTLPEYNTRNAAHNVRRSFAPTAPATIKISRSLPTVSLLGSTGGSNIHGQFALMGLIEKKGG